MRPVLSRKEIQRRVIEGLDKSFDTSTNLTLYLRACERLLRESHSAQAEEDHEQAYFILLRLVELVVNYIPRHPQAKDPAYAARLKRINKTAPGLFVELDMMKTKLDSDYEQYKKYLRAKLEKQAKLDADLRASRRQFETESEQKSRAQESTGNRRSSQISAQDIQKRLQALNMNHNTSQVESTIQEPPSHGPNTYDYPDLKTTRPSLPKSPISFSLPRRLTEPPPSVQESNTNPSNSSDAAGHYFTSTASLENNYPLKTIFIPSSLRDTFLSLASRNTSRNLETCGILSGVLRQNAYFITTLIVPAQESTSDTCHTTDEESLFRYQDEHDLFTVGWIHTHPTQTCFLSSVDVHTHCGYQLMLPESIAIVLAPSKVPAYGVFRLTDPPGVQTIKACTLSGLFHPHQQEGLYVSAGRESAGHVKEVEGMAFTVKDQRDKGGA